MTSFSVAGASEFAAAFALQFHASPRQKHVSRDYAASLLEFTPRSPYSAQMAPVGCTMSRCLRGFLIAMAGITASHAFADQLEEHDPVRVAQRLKDCVVQNLAKHDGRTHTAIRHACKKAVAEGSYQDPNISLDGMTKSRPQQ